MFLKGAIRSGTKGRRNGIFGATMAAILSIPLILWGLPSNPPTGESGAAVGNGGSTCGTNSCHFHGTATAGVITATNLTGTYTPGSTTPIPITVTLGSDTGFGFEMSAVSGSGTSEVQAGSFLPGTGSDVAMGTTTTDAGIQYIRQSSQGSSFAFSWTPPGASVGTVTFNLAGVSSAGIIFATTFTMTPAVTPPPLPTLSVSPTSLTFNVNNGTPTPTTGTITVTSSGAAIPYTTRFSTTNCGNWLTAMPPGANTPTSVTVGINGAGSLPSGTCTGSVVITPGTGSASDGAQTVSVTANVTVTTPPPPPTPPTLNLSPTGLTFTATAGGTAQPQNVSVTTSDGSAQTFSAAATVTTPTGGTWLSIGSATGTIPASGSATETISVNTTGLAASTTPYTGIVTFKCSTCSPTSVTLPVTLTVNASTPPPPTTTPYRFNLVVVDRQSVGSTDWILLDGSGGMNSTGQFQGSGTFTRFHYPSGSTSGGTPAPPRFEREGTGSGGTGSGGTSNTYIVATGRWSATQVMGFSPITSPAGCTPGGTAPCRITGGTLNLQVTLSTQGCGGTSPSPSCSTAPATGSLTITSNGSNAGVTLTTSAWTFVPAGIGTESIGNGDE